MEKDTANIERGVMNEGWMNDRPRGVIKLVVAIINALRSAYPLKDCI